MSGVLQRFLGSSLCGHGVMSTSEKRGWGFQAEGSFSPLCSLPSSQPLTLNCLSAQLLPTSTCNSLPCSFCPLPKLTFAHESGRPEGVGHSTSPPYSPAPHQGSPQPTVDGGCINTPVYKYPRSHTLPVR